MPRRIVAFVLAAGLLLCAAGGELRGEEETIRPSSVARPRGVPAPAGANFTLPRPSRRAADDSKIDHLLQAAEHLAAAEMEEEAARLRELAKHSAERRKAQLLEEKTRELIALQREVEELRQALGRQQQIIVRLHVVEIDSVTAKRLEADGLLQAISAASGEQLSEDEQRGQDACHGGARDARALLKTLLEGRRARVLASPTIVTLNNQPASLQVGGDGGANASGRNIHVDVLPRVLDNGRIQMELRARVEELISGISPELPPSRKVWEIATRVVAASGETLTLGRVDAAEGKSGRKEVPTAEPNEATTSGALPDGQPTEAEKNGAGERAAGKQTFFFITSELAPAIVQNHPDSPRR